MRGPSLNNHNESDVRKLSLLVNNTAVWSQLTTQVNSKFDRTGPNKLTSGASVLHRAVPTNAAIATDRPKHAMINQRSKAFRQNKAFTIKNRPGSQTKRGISKSENKFQKETTQKRKLNSTHLLIW